MLVERVRRDAGRVGIRARNALRHLSEVDRPQPSASPRQLVWQRDKVTLWRYDSGSRHQATPILLVMSLVTRPYVFDLRPGASLVARLLADGFDVYLLDWGVPDAVEAANTLETYCDEYLPLATAAVATESAASGVTIVGYCLGAVLSLLAVAGNDALPVSKLVLLAPPVDFSTFGAFPSMFGTGRIDLDDFVDETGNVPAGVMRDGIRLLQPTGDLLGLANLWLRLEDPRFLEAYQSLVGWSMDHIPFPGAAFRQVVELFFRQACLVEGRVPLGGRMVDLGSVRCPVLSVTGDDDHLVP